MLSISALVALTTSLVSAVTAATPRLPLPPPLAHDAVGVNGTATFEQLIDHNNPELGTFSQRYFWSSQYWKGPGSPVVLFTPGEAAADRYQGYLSNSSITGLYAQTIGGAVIVIEHRYYGESSPFDTLTVKNLQYLTLEQSIADLTYFAKNVKLPFDFNSSSTADKAPWVLSGGSYSGALAAWTASTSPGTFWAYHASSAPVEAIYDYWQYFEPVQLGMPVNCSTDLSHVVDYIDNILQSSDAIAKKNLKDLFGLGGLEHDDDFVAALENGPWQWQTTSLTQTSSFYEFCDYVENAQGNSSIVPGADGVGLNKALSGYAKWWNEVFFPDYCSEYGYWSDPKSIACFDTYNQTSPLFTDLTVSNSINRQWNWFLCNEPFFYWQDGASKNVPSIVSRLVTAEYWQRQCSLFFPEEDGYTYGSAKGRSATDVNVWTKGWFFTNSTRLIWTNGEWDPWRSAGVSSDFRPGGPLQSTSQAPIQVIPAGVHCYDLLLRNAKANPGVQKVVNNEVAQIKEWVAEYYQNRAHIRRTVGM